MVVRVVLVILVVQGNWVDIPRWVCTIEILLIARRGVSIPARVCGIRQFSTGFRFIFLYFFGLVWTTATSMTKIFALFFLLDNWPTDKAKLISAVRNRIHLVDWVAKKCSTKK